MRMKDMFRKLKSKVGESLIETLCAIMIFTMASVVLYSMVTSAADINAKVKVKDMENQAHLVAVEKGENDARNGTAEVIFTMQVAGTGGTREKQIAKMDVDIYGGEDDSLFTYFVHTNPTAGG